jgi:uncharacterized protein YndB with AHSA1/START domain
MDDVIEKTINLTVPVARVWRALADHIEFGAWFQAEISGPFIVGTKLLGSTTSPDYDCATWEMTIKRMEPEQLFSFEWRDVPELGTVQDPATLVEFHLEEIPTGTRLMIIESGFAALPEGRRLEVFRDNTNGWNEQARNIAAYVAT